MLSADHARLTRLRPAQAAGLTTYLEARSEPVLGLVGVLWVIKNRARIVGEAWPAICFQPLQFSCWNASDVQSTLGGELGTALLEQTALPDRADRVVLETCLWLADRIRKDDTIPDPTTGATHYHTITMSPRPPWAYPPSHQTVTIGRHVFYRHVAPFLPRP